MVARKCAQQNLESHHFDMQETLKVLNMECEAALLNVKNKKEKEKGRGKDAAQGGRSVMEGANSVFVGTELSQFSAQKSQAEGFLKNSQDRAQDTRGFLASMRERAMKSRAEQMEIAKKGNEGA